MRHTDVLIVGGGLAGSTAAAMLGRRGINAVVVDPHEVYPADFRCERLDAAQVELLRKAGLADAILPATAPAATLRVARFGRMLDDKPVAQNGILYDDLVNAMRAAIPPPVPLIKTKVTGIATSTNRQTVTLANGAIISARLVVVASGLHLALLHALGLKRVTASRCHSIAIGFDVEPVGAATFPFDALIYHPERPADRAAYLALFPVNGAMRGNYMVYRDLADPWLGAFRENPHAALTAIMPGLTKAMGGDFKVTGTLGFRPADIYTTAGHIQPGVVLIGDAFATSCPAAGTGAGKVFTDVERLCGAYVPEWLASPGMDADKIAAFYGDAAKRAYDAYSIGLAYGLRSLSIDTGFRWRAERVGRFAVRLALGLRRRAGAIFGSPATNGGAAAPEAGHV